MKNRFIYLVAATALALGASSCQKLEDSVFDQPATQRMEAKLAEYEEQLMSSDQGWVFNYYPDTTAYGAFHFLIDFQTATEFVVGVDEFLSDNGKYEKGLYSLNDSQGPVLSFNTYTYINKLSDPVNDFGFNYGSGWSGENEFVLVDSSADGDTIYLKGKKNNQPAMMYRNHMEWNEYFTNLNKMYNTLLNTPTYFKQVKVNEDVVLDFAGYSSLTRTLTTYYRYSADSIVTLPLPLNITPEGFEFHAPYQAAEGVTLKSFTYNEAENVYYSDDLEGVKFEGVSRPNIVLTDANKHIFVNEDFYNMNLGSLNYENYQKVIAFGDVFFDVLVDRGMENKVSFGGFSFMSDGAGGYVFVLTAVYDNTLYPAIYVPLTIKKSDSTTDYLSFQAPPFFGYTESSIHDLGYLREDCGLDFKGELNDAFLTLVKTFFTNHGYTVIPANYNKTFTLASTKENLSFEIYK